jgi:hypothetical protein
VLADVTVAGGDEIGDHVVFEILPALYGECVWTGRGEVGRRIKRGSD